MESKILQVFYGNDALPYKDSERSVHYPIVGNSFVGASGTTQIRFYVRDIGGTTNVSWVAISKLPNGKIGNQVLSTIHYDDVLNEYYVEFDLSAYYTQLKGDLYISLNGYQGNIQVEQDEETDIYTIVGTPIIEATGSIKLSINYAPQLPQGDHFNISDLQQILGALSEKANILNTVVVVGDISTQDMSGFDIGQLFYDNTTKTYYRKYSNVAPTQYVRADYGLIGSKHAMLKFYSSEYITFSSIVDQVSYGQVFEYNYNGYDYIVQLSLSGTTLTACAFDVLSRNYYYRNDLTLSNSFSDLLTSTYKTNYVDKAYIDSAVQTILRNAFILVDTTTYTTLDSFLASNGQEGYVYLYPIDTSDLTKGYHQYIWESDSWLFIGDTNIDLSQYATKSWVNTTLEDYATKSYVGTAINNYDTTIKTWVGNQNYATSSDIGNVMDLLNYNVHVETQTHEFTMSGDTVTFTCAYVNLKTGISGTRQETIPLANATTAGMMSSSDYSQIRSNTSRIEALEGRAVRIKYTASNNPTANDIKTFATTYLATLGITSPTDADYSTVSVVVEGTNHIWNYYSNTHAYQDDGLDTVTQFTNSIAGVIQGTPDNESHTNDGKVYAENDGTGSVLGWDRLTTRVYNLENGGYITVNVTNLVNYYDKDTIDLMLNDYATTTDISDMATQTWVGQQGYLTSLPSNVAYKDINNNFSTRQTISSASNDDTPLVLKGMYSNTSYIAYFHGDTYNGRIGVTSDGKAVLQSAYTGLTDKEIALKDDTLKNAYHLGAFDSVDTSNSAYDLITRRTKVVKITKVHGSYSGTQVCQGVFNTPDSVDFSTSDQVINDTMVASITRYTPASMYGENRTGICSYKNGNGDNMLIITAQNCTTEAQLNAYLSANPIYVEYQLSSSYTEKVIKNQPLNTLDQNGSEWLRNEWEKGLNLFDINGKYEETYYNPSISVSGSTLTVTGYWYTIQLIKVKKYTNYNISSIISGTVVDLLAVYEWTGNDIGNVLTRIYSDNGSPTNDTFNTGSYDVIALLFYGGNATSGTTTYTNTMLVEGDHAYPYKDYNGKLIHEKDLETFESGENLFATKLTDKQINGSNGAIETASNYDTYIGEIKPNTTYTISGVSTNKCAVYSGYPSSSTFIGLYDLTFTSPSNAKYVGTSTTNSYQSVMLNLGSTPQPFKEYVGAIVREGGNQIVQLKKLTIEDNTVDAVPLEIKAYDPECDIRFTDNDGGSTTDLYVRKMDNTISLPGIDGTIVVAESGWKTLTLNSSNLYSAQTTLKEYDTFMAYEIITDGGSGNTKVIASMGIHYIPPVSPNSSVNMDLISMAYAGSNNFVLSIRNNGYAYISKNDHGSRTYTIMYKKIDMGY